MRIPPLEICPSSWRRVGFAVMAALLCMFAGCGPETVVCWAPDGEHAILKGSDGTYVINSEGKVIADAPDAFGWMADSRRVIAIRRVKARNWDEVAALLGEDRAHRTARAAEELETMLLNYHGDWAKFFDSKEYQFWDDSAKPLRASYGDSMDGANALVSGTMTLPFFYIYQKHPNALEPIEKATLSSLQFDPSGSYPRVNGDEFNNFERFKRPGAIFDCAVYEMVIRSALPEGGQKESVILRSVDRIRWAQSSPNGQLIATLIDQPVSPSLSVIPSQGGGRAPVDTGIFEPSWTPDSEFLVYAKTEASFDHRGPSDTGTLTQCRVMENGAHVRVSKDLATVFLSSARVACLPDGRILFASERMALPATIPDPHRGRNLFILTPGDTPQIRPVVREEDESRLPDRLDLFSLSPDGKYVAAPGANGEVLLITLEDGKIQGIQEKFAELSEKKSFANLQDLAGAVPSWRNAREFSYVVPAGAFGAGPRRGEFVLRTLDGAPRIISKTWSEGMTDGFLPRPKFGG